MKKIFTITLAALLVVFAATSCVKEFLDIKPRGSDIATKIEHFQGLLDAKNFMSFSGSTYMHMGEELCGDAQTLERLLSSEKDKGVYAFKFDRDPFRSENTCDEWESSYSKIYTCNFIINNVMNAENGTEAQKKAVWAEAKMQRAYMHFFASIMFSKHYNEATAATDLAVPIVTEAATENSSTYTRPTVKEFYDWIISEMKEAIPFLPEGYGVTRCSVAAGNYLLGRIYWYMGDYQNALTCLSTSLSKVKGFEGTPVKFLSFRDNAAIWTGAAGYFTSFVDVGYNPESLLIRYLASTTYVSATQASFHYVKPEYVAKYKEGDLRKRFLGPGKPDATQLRLVTRQFFNIMCDLPELYFMLAECEARVGSESNARDLMLEYRKSRFDSDDNAAIPAEISSKEDLIRFIVDERNLEYIGRGASVIDMKRLWDDPIFEAKKANFTHPVKDGETYTLTSVDQLTWKIPLRIKKFHADWQDN
ncbi:MAG: RagB/SusD family nutrient uptake outer membrane protein [Bacteroidales bacterium]|nr:RagB/SusD family nutrient uptake outer membrane protein [Candidatus Cacconaster merdequi]